MGIYVLDLVGVQSAIAQGVNNAASRTIAVGCRNVMREIDGMSYEDIAESMNCPIGTVRSRIFRAREAIATRLRPLLGDTGKRRW